MIISNRLFLVLSTSGVESTTNSTIDCHALEVRIGVKTRVHIKNEDGKVGDECVQFVRLSSSAHNVLALSLRLFQAIVM